MDQVVYTKDHEWLKIEGNLVTIGVTQFAQEQLGDVVFIELPEVGGELISRVTKRQLLNRLKQLVR